MTHLTETVEALATFLEREGGRLVLSYDKKRGEWICGSEFGEEEPGSEMAAGASYAVGPSLASCLEEIRVEVRA